MCWGRNTTTCWLHFKTYHIAVVKFGELWQPHALPRTIRKPFSMQDCTSSYKQQGNSSPLDAGAHWKPESWPIAQWGTFLLQHPHGAKALQSVPKKQKQYHQTCHNPHHCADPYSYGTSWSCKMPLPLRLTGRPLKKNPMNKEIRHKPHAKHIPTLKQSKESDQSPGGA